MGGRCEIERDRAKEEEALCLGRKKVGDPKNADECESVFITAHARRWIHLAQHVASGDRARTTVLYA